MQSMPNAEVLGIENLHAKCYGNETTAIITSMNFYEYSIEHNWEMGVLIDEDNESWDSVQNEIDTLRYQCDELWLGQDDEVHIPIMIKITTGGVEPNPIYLITENPYKTDYKLTIGVNLLRYKHNDEELRYSFQIWEVSSQPRYRFIIQSMLTGSLGGIHFFDIGKKERLDALIPIMDYYNKKNLPCKIVGIRSDSAAVTQQYAKEITEKYHCELLYYNEEITKEMMQELLDTLIEQILKDIRT
jgi:hypothetical protein